jgi:hypothetical protein
VRGGGIYQEGRKEGIPENSGKFLMVSFLPVFLIINSGSGDGFKRGRILLGRQESMNPGKIGKTFSWIPRFLLSS